MKRALWCYQGFQSVAQCIEDMIRPLGYQLDIVDSTLPLEEQVSDVHVLFPSSGRITREVLEKAKVLQIILQPAAGYENIDLHSASSLGIPVCNAPGHNASATAEITVYLMLAVARRVREAESVLTHGGIGRPFGMELRGKTLGIIGSGKIGKIVEGICQNGFGMRILTVKTSSSELEWSNLLAESDFISIHCPLSESTRGMINKNVLSKMKKGVLLVSCARAAIVDYNDLLEAVRSGHVGGLGLDVHWEEPVDMSREIYSHPRVVSLPHIGSSSEEAVESVSHACTENLRRFLVQEPLLNRLA